MIRIATAILSAALFTTCRSVGRSPLVLDSDIWVAVEGADGDSIPLPADRRRPDSRPSVEFFSDGQLSGYTSCNSFFGSYKTSPTGLPETTALEVNIDGMTMALCPDNETEQEYIERLRRVRGYTVSDHRLRMMDSTGMTVLIFAPASMTHKK